METILHQIFLRSPQNLFDEFMIEAQKWYDQPAHTLTEMRCRDNKKVRGDFFEEFCVLYLHHVRKFDNVWRLEDVPESILTKLALKRQDMGIDIICEHGGKYYAVQSKYKKHTSMKKNIVTWKALSTFYALVLRTGPWEKFIVMTNCEYCRHMGRKTAKDVSLCIGSLRSITKDQWVSMCGLTAGSVIEKKPPVSQDELRRARLAYYDKKTNTEINDKAFTQDTEKIHGASS